MSCIESTDFGPALLLLGAVALILLHFNGRWLAWLGRHGVSTKLTGAIAIAALLVGAAWQAAITKCPYQGGTAREPWEQHL